MSRDDQRGFWEREDEDEDDIPNDITRWRQPTLEEVIGVTNVATGCRFLMRVDDHVKVGTDKKIAVLEEVEPGKFLDRVFVGRFLELEERYVIARKTASWDVSRCDRPQDGKCLCRQPHVVDHSAEFAHVRVGDILHRVYPKLGLVFFRVTRIDDRGVWGRVTSEEQL